MLHVTAANCKPGSYALVHASIVQNLNFPQHRFAMFTDQI